MRGDSTDEAGFTLLEMASILAVGWLLVGSAVPYLASIARRSRLQSEARTVGLVLTGARMQAMKRGETVGVEVSTDPHRPSCRRAVVFLDTGSVAGALDRGDTIVGNATIVEDGELLWIDAENAASPSSASGTVDFVFTRLGSPGEGSSRKSVYLGDRAGNLIQVAFQPGLSGRVKTTKRAGAAFAGRPWQWS
jgi:Tfp pilus assembly protein FimT